MAPPKTLVATDLEQNTMVALDGSNPEKTTTDCDSEKQIQSPSETSSTKEDLGDKMEYPPARKTILIMLSLYLTMFLMALVSDESNTTFIIFADYLVGPHDYRNCHS